MNRDAIFPRLKSLCLEQFKLLTEQITEEARFREDLMADSLDMVEFAMVVEEEFGLDIPDETLATFLTVGDALNHLETQDIS